MMAKRGTPEGSRKRGSIAQAGATSPGDHIPVLLAPVIEHLNLMPGGVYVDATFGAGGYSRAMLETCDIRVIGVDRDPAARIRGDEFRAEFGERFIFCAGRFGELAALVEGAGFPQVDAIVFDIGVSSMQIDDGARGFSFQVDGPLDMRMSSFGPSAADLVNKLSDTDLAQTFKFYGEERRARAIARRIVERREVAAITKTSELVDIIQSVLGKPLPHKKHPATRVFQALRIAVNEELHELVSGLRAAEQILKVDGRLVVVDFHSLEDRIVKQFLRTRAGLNPNISRHLPEDPSNFIKPSFQIINRRPVIANDDELAVNPRARSARLRSAVRLDANIWPLSSDDFGLPDTGLLL